MRSFSRAWDEEGAERPKRQERRRGERKERTVKEE
jgi:hypothetical protein